MKTFILANREHVLNDVAQSFPGEEISHFAFKPDMKPFLDTAIEFARIVLAGSRMGENIRIVLAGPTAIAYVLGMTFAHASRNVTFSYLDLESKAYVDLDLSDHRKVHI